MDNLVRKRGVIIIGMPCWIEYPPKVFFDKYGYDESESKWMTAERTSESFINDGYNLKYLFVSSRQESDYYQSNLWRNRKNEELSVEEHNRPLRCLALQRDIK